LHKAPPVTLRETNPNETDASENGQRV